MAELWALNFELWNAEVEVTRKFQGGYWVGEAKDNPIDAMQPMFITYSPVKEDPLDLSTGHPTPTVGQSDDLG